MPDLDLIYFTARELPPEDRPAYLTKACEGDAGLWARVEQMLAVSDEAEAFMAGPSDAIVATIRLDLKPGDGGFGEKEGDRVGPYILRQQIGEGGFGTVWMAEQTEPIRRMVALKVIKAGMDTREVLARFAAERQALAMTDHPNIAKVLDAGATAQGRPYFAMELVKGIPITTFCDDQNYGVRRRLELFQEVCSAVNHAHQKGIIHRDLKPSNVMVTLHGDKPVPKVIDFGIAKATQGKLTDQTLFTRFEQFLGTPAYMSPEQAAMSGLDIDTRSDIYSLGVLLYELLAGRTPFDAKELMASGIDAMWKTIREKEPQRPSTKLSQTLVAADVRRLKSPSSDQPATEEEVRASSRRLLRVKEAIHHVKGDLDWIVMKCLEKDRSRRYETANGLAADIGRYLSDEPVQAVAPSAVYVFRKFARRHRAAFGVATAMLLLLVAATVVSTWQAIRATRAGQAEVKQRMAAQDAQAEATAQQKKAEAEKQRAEEQLTRAEWLVYASKLTLAQSDFETGNGGLAQHYLDECQPNLRGWEHRYLSTRIKAKQTLEGHTYVVSSVAFSPDGRRILTGSRDKTAKVWDVATGRELMTLKGHKGFVMSVAFSSDGQRIVTGGGEWGVGKKSGEARVWDSKTGELLLDLAGHSYCVCSVAFSPDGQRIVTGAGDWGNGPGEAIVWDAMTGREILTIPEQAKGVRSVAFSPNNRNFITGSAGRATVWDAATGQEVLVLRGLAGLVSSVAFSPNGQRIITGSTDQATVWSAATGQEEFVLRGHKGGVLSVAFSSDGQRIVTGSMDQTIKVWDAATGREVFTLKGHAGDVRSVRFSPDGQRIVSGSADLTAKVWDAATGQEVPTLKGHSDFVGGIAFSPDSKRIVTGSGDGTAKVWDTASGREILTLGIESIVWNVAGVSGVAFSPDGQRIVTGSYDQTARVWNAVTGQQLLLLQHTRIVSSVAFSPDGRRIVTGDGEWDRPDSRPGDTKVWDAATGRELLSLPHTRVVWTVAFSPDGQRIVTGDGDRTATVSDAATGQEVFALQGHIAALRGVQH